MVIIKKYLRHGSTSLGELSELVECKRVVLDIDFREGELAGLKHLLHPN